MTGHRQSRVKFNTIRPQWRQGAYVKFNTIKVGFELGTSDSTPLSLDLTSSASGNPRSRVTTCVHEGRLPRATPNLWSHEVGYLYGCGIEAWLGSRRSNF
ncbi:hypothetical protein BT93_E2038 [Corymbia citriodora subsp. variegata]|nr:hypothetical protein BT93_E2038 [Corymbia citriodora subsp. variegata]